MAAHVAADGDKFQCARCPWNRHCDDTNPAPFAQWSIPGVLESNTCLLPMITPDSHRFLRLHKHYGRGLLPHAGGICDQPNRYIEAMECLEAAFAGIESERRRDAERGR